MVKPRTPTSCGWFQFAEIHGCFTSIKWQGEPHWVYSPLLAKCIGQHSLSQACHQESGCSGHNRSRPSPKLQGKHCQPRDCWNFSSCWSLKEDEWFGARHCVSLEALHGTGWRYGLEFLALQPSFVELVPTGPSAPAWLLSKQESEPSRG